MAKPLGDSNQFDFETHPSWGMVQFSRVQGGPCRLFGSALEAHGTRIMLRVYHAKRSHNHGTDWYMADSRLPIVEVEMSAAQFAALLTTMNIGDGVPATIRSVNGERVPELPKDAHEAGRVRESVRQDFAKILDRMSDILSSAYEILRKPNIKAADRTTLREQLDHIVRTIRANLPFMVEQFERATEQITVEAKAEVDAFITDTAARLGMERLREISTTGQDTLHLQGGKVDTDEEESCASSVTSAKSR